MQHKEDKDYFSIEEIKQEYAKYRKKHALPKFSELNVLFDIEEVDAETEFFLRRIRKIISEKLVGYLRFLEIILNPSNAPMFFFKLIKKLDNKDKENLTKVYERLGNLEIEIVKLDLDYSEEREAEFIKSVFKVFSEIKGDILKVVNKMVDGGSESSKKEAGSYFG